jgi:hypothetical protein
MSRPEPVVIPSRGNSRGEDEKMQRVKILGVALAAVFAMSAITATASLAAEYIFKVNGAKLEAGQTREVTSKAKKEFVLEGEVLGVKAVTKCKKEKLNAAEKPVIVGGIPGKSEKEKIEFSECSATVGGVACKSVTVENVPTNNEIVTIVKPAAKAGKLATKFTPSAGTKFTEIKFKECGGFGSPTAEVTGTTAALDSPEKVEQETGALIWSKPEEITEVEKSSKAKETVGLKFAGKAATLEGEAEVTLVSKEKWGVF